MHRIGRILSTACIGLVLAAVAGDAAIAKPQHGRRSGEVIRAWSEIARSQAFGNPIMLSRVLAIMHAAQHDAVNGAEPRYETYASRLSDRKADAEAAAAAAAHRVLVSFFPANQAALDAALVDSLASIPDGPAESAGVALGQAVGQLLLDVRANDGFDVPDPFAPTPGPGVWEPTPPAFAPMLEAQFQNVRPFTLRDRSQFLPRAAAGPGERQVRERLQRGQAPRSRTRARCGRPTRLSWLTSGPRAPRSAGAASGASSRRAGTTTSIEPRGCSLS